MVVLTGRVSWCTGYGRRRGDTRCGARTYIMVGLCARNKVYLLVRLEGFAEEDGTW